MQFTLFLFVVRVSSDFDWVNDGQTLGRKSFFMALSVGIVSGKQYARPGKIEEVFKGFICHNILESVIPNNNLCNLRKNSVSQHRHFSLSTRRLDPLYHVTLRFMK